MPAHSGFETPLNWLVNHSLQAGLLVLLVLAVQWLFRRQLTNRWRFALWWVVLARLLLPFSPQSAVSLFNVVRPEVQLAGLRQVASAPITQDNDRAPASTPVRANSTSENAGPAAQFPIPTILPPSLKPATVLTAPQSPLNLHDFIIPGLTALWLAGVLILSGVVVAQLIRFNRKLARGSAPSRPELQVLLDDCRHEFGVLRPIELVETDAVQSPALFGLRRLRLLLPRGIGEQFANRELRYIFLHEIAHVKRGDLWLNWLVTALQILHWFNPLLWFGFARFRADRELACDELALLRAGDQAGTAYGETVVKLLENLSRPSVAIPGLVGILEDKKQMRRRISMIVDFRRPGRWSALAVILIAAIAAMALTDAQTNQPAGARIKVENDVNDIAGLNNAPTVGSYDPYFIQENRMSDIVVTISTNSHAEPGLAPNTAWGKKYTNSPAAMLSELAGSFSVSVWPSPANVAYTITPRLKPIPGKQIGGVVLLPDGKPAADAQVAFRVDGYPIQLGRAKFKDLPLTGLASTAADGSFALPLYENARSIIALSRDGFADVAWNPSDSPVQITLQKWGRIEGTLRTGDRVGTNEMVGLWPGRNPRPHPPMSFDPPLDPYLVLEYDLETFQSRTDDQGRFAFGFVPPGWQNLGRQTKTDDGWTSSPLSRLEVLSGETTVTNLSGRTVIGRLEFGGGLPQDLTNGIGFIIGATNVASQFPVFDIGADGAFRAEYVLPGIYNFRFVQYRHRLPDENRFLSIEGQISFSRRPFFVPEAKNSDDDSTIALGTIELE